MGKGYLFALVTTVVFVSGYAYYAALAICPVPIEYSIGTLDDRFDITRDEAKLVAAEAEAVWEDATGRNLFSYNEEADFTINFVYDERQAFTKAELAERARLDETESASSEIQNRYEQLVEEYNELQVSHEEQVAGYEAALVRYNQRVEEYNQSGGAPASEFTALEAEAKRLETVQASINNTASTLNEMVAEINEIGERGNQLVELYNAGVENYNDTFNTHREFTQGTYTSDGEIDIYTFENEAELRLVIAHEFGHALSIDHVAGSESVMYFLIGEQPDPTALTTSDLEGFAEVCGYRDFWDTITLGFTSLFIR